MAVKLRQQNGRDRPSVMVYEEEEATRKYLAWQEAVNKEVPIRVLEEVEPPDMNVKEFPLHVVPGVGNPSLFWIHYGQRSAEMLDTMQRVLNSCKVNTTGAGWSRLTRAVMLWSSSWTMGTLRK